MYAIRRHRAAVKAWCWRVNFKRRGKPYSKSFYDLVCGGSEKAKAAAIAWRDQKLAVLKAFTLVEFHKQKRSNNVSGVPGVHFHITPAQPLGYWQATIRFHDGKRIARTFSVLKCGNKEAFRMAVAARSELLAKVENRPYLYDPVAKRFVGQQ
jgi:hypothetical protein